MRVHASATATMLIVAMTALAMIAPVTYAQTDTPKACISKDTIFSAGLRLGAITLGISLLLYIAQVLGNIMNIELLSRIAGTGRADNVIVMFFVVGLVIIILAAGFEVLVSEDSNGCAIINNSIVRFVAETISSVFGGGQ